MYYKNAASVALIYDSCIEDSFASIERWVQEIELNGAHQLQLALVANKCDMAE
jgi:GTPase SAR1 family protein